MPCPQRFYYHQPMTDQITSPQEDQEVDALSLCDLPIHGTHDSSSTDSHEASNDEPFEFFPSDFPSQEANHVLFCGKLIPPKGIASHKEGTALGYGRFARRGSQRRRSRFKWCFLVFGLQKFSAPKMTNLSDMRNRLSRRSPKSLEEMFEKSTSYNSNNSSSSSSSSCSNSKSDNGLSYLIRSLSCRSKRSISVLN